MSALTYKLPIAERLAIAAVRLSDLDTMVAETSGSERTEWLAERGAQVRLIAGLQSEAGR